MMFSNVVGIIGQCVILVIIIGYVVYKRSKIVNQKNLHNICHIFLKVPQRDQHLSLQL